VVPLTPSHRLRAAARILNHDHENALRGCGAA